MTAVEFFSARNGQLTARLGPRQLHSRFDPEREAARFAEQVESPQARTVVVIGPGLGYCFRPLRRRFPASRIIGISLDERLASRPVDRPDVCWSPSAGGPLDGFLGRAFTDLQATSVTVVEWPPVVEALPEPAAAVRSVVRSFLKRCQASLLTQGAAGRRWLRNRIHNYVHIRPVSHATGTRRVSAVVLAGAGPTLERSIPMIAAARDRVALWVTGSALDAVIHHGLVPDLVIVTDAAPYAAEHLRAVVAGSSRGVPIAGPLSATRGLASCEHVFVISEGDTVDEALLTAVRPAAPVVPPHGTVTATAAGLARRLTAAPLVVAGVDFGWYDGRSHARPHVSHVYRDSGASRLAPASTRTADTELSLRTVEDKWATDRTLRTYADWFKENADRRFAPVFALAPSALLAGVTEVTADRLSSWPSEHADVTWESADWPGPVERARRARAYLDRLADRFARLPCPQSHSSAQARSTEFMELATRLALPTVLRWYREPGAPRSDLWNELREQLVDELTSARRLAEPGEDDA